MTAGRDRGRTRMFTPAVKRALAVAAGGAALLVAIGIWMDRPDLAIAALVGLVAFVLVLVVPPFASGP